jgi:ligand-binding SRPBCC domain-containing protein
MDQRQFSNKKSLADPRSIRSGSNMPHHYIGAIQVARPAAELFAYFTRPRNLLQLAPPELNLQLISGPELLTLGARLVWKGKRWGVSQQLTQEVVTFDPDRLIVIEQKEGPFKSWLHASYFEKHEETTKIVEKIDFEPPGGLLGYVLTADKILQDVQKLVAYREKKLKELFPG